MRVTLMRSGVEFGFAIVVGLNLAGHCAGATPPVTTFNLGMSSFLENAAGTTIYALVPSQNEVVSIDASTLTVTNTISTSLSPAEITLSMDGSKLYVANQGSTSLDVINTSGFSAGTPIDVGATSLSVAAGTNNRLWVLVGIPNHFDAIEQVDASTGASTGPNINGTLVYGGDLRTTADGQTLLYGDYGTSGSYLARFDVPGANPSNSKWAIDPGGNGEDLEMSSDGKHVVLICGGGNNGLGSPYGDAIYNTSDGSVVAGFHVGAYPECFAFSPDDLVGYAGEDFTSPDIQIFNLSNSTEVGSIVAASDPGKLFVDSSGRYLFADEGSQTEVFATGRVAPEPGTPALLLCAAAAWIGGRRKRVASERDLR